jgi:hypothetical protein
VTFAKNCASCAAEVFGAVRGAEVVGVDEVVVAADTAGPPAATTANAIAHTLQADATNRRWFHPAAATCAALQILPDVVRRHPQSNGVTTPAGYHCQDVYVSPRGTSCDRQRVGSHPPIARERSKTRRRPSVSHAVPLG